MSETFSRRNALTSGLGLMGGLGFLATNAMAQAPRDEHAHQEASGGGPDQKSLAASVGKAGEYVLPPLPYGYDALEPSIGAETMKLRHDKHHAAYVKGANDALAKYSEIREGKVDLASVPEWTEKLTFNSNFWAVLGSQGGELKGAIAGAIVKNFGSADKFKTHFLTVATQVQGNGWAVLAYEPVLERLIVLQAKNHQLSVAWNAIPLAVIDVWEHAYSLKYRNVRADYVKAFWSVVNWSAVEEWYAFIKKTRHQPAREHGH